MEPISLRISKTELKRLKLRDEQRALWVRFERALDRISDARDTLHALNTPGIKGNEALSQFRAELLERIRMAERMRDSLALALKPVSAQLRALDTKQRALQTLLRLGEK
jgi:hypothetical protein